MKVLILGASGIVAQHLRLCVPEGIEAVWVRQHADPITQGCDLTRDAVALLDEVHPDVVVNLAGESNVDIVDHNPVAYRAVNVELPMRLAEWCRAHSKRMIQVSSQAVFRGSNPPYRANDARQPVNHYGVQKASAEDIVFAADASIVRLTFVVGIRPLPHVGRQNPLEAMIAGQSPQVADRFFSPLLAWDAAELLWEAVQTIKPHEIRQFGVPVAHSRFGIAKMVNDEVEACESSAFPNIATRPVDTTYRDSKFLREIGAVRSIAAASICKDRAIEISLFLGIPLDVADRKLSQGFGALHNAVTEDFRAAKPETEADLLEWYRNTEAYIWELSAYHEDVGFNYSGMCNGIADRLRNDGMDRVLCLGDGIGDLTLTLMRRPGMHPVYHDLAGSRTSQYAKFRLWRQTGTYPACHFSDSEKVPEFIAPYDAVCSLDFLEHVTDVEAWVRGIHAALGKGGLFFAQNAFACGSGPDGSMPMHLACNDHWEHDWDDMLKSVGFLQLSSNWYRKL